MLCQPGVEVLGDRWVTGELRAQSTQGECGEVGQKDDLGYVAKGLFKVLNYFSSSV